MSQSTELNCCDTNCCEPGAESRAAELTIQPRVDILESADAWLLRAEMPGVDEAHSDVQLERQLLTIRGAAELQEPSGFQRQYGTFRTRRYERSFRLPEAIDRSGVTASVQHGVLSVRVPKAQEAQPTKIPVKGA